MPLNLGDPGYRHASEVIDGPRPSARAPRGRHELPNAVPLPDDSLAVGAGVRIDVPDDGADVVDRPGGAVIGASDGGQSSNGAVFPNTGPGEARTVGLLN